MKKRKFFFGSFFVFLGVIALLIVMTNKSNISELFLRGEPESYSVTLSDHKNKLVADSVYRSGSGYIKTGLNNSILCNYVDLKYAPDTWQEIKAGGSFENHQALSGLTSLSIIKGNSKTHIGIYWSETRIFNQEQYQEFDSSSSLEVLTYFNDEHPHHFKIVALGSSEALIVSMQIEFSCVYVKPQYVKLGSYPQTKVTSAALMTILNDEAGSLQTWTSYNYYISSSNETDFMWYQDILHEGQLYRGVYFDKYRPYYTSDSSSQDTSYQDDNGYFINTIYWFKFEPIQWKVLAVDETDQLLLLSDKMVYAQEYYHAAGVRTKYDGTEVYSNNYKESNIRNWLNNSFYDTAFNNEEKSLILTTEVDNTVSSTGFNPNEYACENTNDKLFILSHLEATSRANGLNNDYQRTRQATDYAKAMGIWVNLDDTWPSSQYYENSHWWLRSPSKDGGRVRYVCEHGAISSGYPYDAPVTSTYIGILPALKIER